GQVQEFLNSEKSNLIIIDHHNEVEAKTPGIFSFPEIGSTSEIIYELIELSGNVPDYNASVALYLGIIMDTGQFKYNKTRPRTHEIAAKLLQNNFPTEELSRKLFEDFPYQKLFLKRDVYQSIKIEPEHKLASLQITQEVLKKYDSSNSLGESLVNELLGPVEIVKAVIFTESDNGQIKISFRSKGKVDVCMIAKEFGGGGHTNASGATVAGSLEEVKRKVLERLRF
ncbi:MAG: hypothetical protein K8R21_12045, partial [Leptospira sp.]|nr:hypothetical protein [Leptospira sp.]